MVEKEGVMNMAGSKPLVSIGMPVYNGERFIRQALDSLLAQDYENFELIISDNASTDGTREICLEYGAKDKRIRYYQNEKNMGGAWNFRHVLELASGEYFMWAAHDDLWEPDFVSTLTACLTRNRELIYAMSHFDTYNYVTKQRKIRPPAALPAINESNDIFKNCILFVSRPWSNLFYGIYKIEVLKQSRFVKLDYFDWGDLYLLNEICTLGKMHIVPKVLFHTGVVEAVRPVRSFARWKLPGFKYSYHEYYLQSCRCFLTSKNLNPSQKLYLLRLLTTQVVRLVLAYEHIPTPARIVLERSGGFVNRALGKVLPNPASER